MGAEEALQIMSKAVTVVGRNFFVGREYFEEEKNMKKIFVIVSGGVAEVCEDTVPQGYEVEIIDFDNIRDGDEYPSPEAVKYATKEGWVFPEESNATKTSTS
jgi:hypothetical protein